MIRTKHAYNAKMLKNKFYKQKYFHHLKFLYIAIFPFYHIFHFILFFLAIGQCLKCIQKMSLCHLIQSIMCRQFDLHFIYDRKYIIYLIAM